MQQRVHLLRLRTPAGERAGLGVALSQIAVLFCVMALLAAVVYWFG